MTTETLEPPTSPAARITGKDPAVIAVAVAAELLSTQEQPAATVTT